MKKTRDVLLETYNELVKQANKLLKKRAVNNTSHILLEDIWSQIYYNRNIGKGVHFNNKQRDQEFNLINMHKHDKGRSYSDAEDVHQRALLQSFNRRVNNFGHRL